MYIDSYRYYTGQNSSSQTISEPQQILNWTDSAKFVRELLLTTAMSKLCSTVNFGMYKVTFRVFHSFSLFRKFRKYHLMFNFASNFFDAEKIYHRVEILQNFIILSQKTCFYICYKWFGMRRGSVVISLDLDSYHLFYFA